MARTREYCTIIFLSSALLVRILHATFIFVTTVKTLYNVTLYNRIFNIQHKIAGNGSVSIIIPSI